MRTKIGTGCVLLMMSLLAACWFCPMKSCAAERKSEEGVPMGETMQTPNLSDWMDKEQLHSIQKEIDSMFPGQSISFTQMCKDVMQGNLSFKGFGEVIKQSLYQEVGDMKGIFMFLVVIGIISALFTNFSKMFESHQIADISYYLLYLFLITVLLKTFYISLETSKETIRNIVLFVKILVPTFYVAIGVSGGVLSATFFYQVILVIIFGVETILLSFILPVIYSYVFLVIINGITEDDRFLLLAEMIKKAIRSILNISLAVVTGIGVLQSMIAPVIDGVKINAVQKIASAIPGIGNIADSVTEMVLGSAILIKNSVGVVLFLLLLFVCFLPVLKLLLFTIVLKGSAAVIAMVADKRMAKCAEQVGDGNGLLLKTVITALALFLITVAIISLATNKGF